MITIIRAWTQRGWSGADHMIDDSALAESVGRTYAHVGAALQSLRPRTDRRGYLSFEFQADNGREYVYDDSPAGIPGRNVTRVREISR